MLTIKNFFENNSLNLQKIKKIQTLKNKAKGQKLRTLGPYSGYQSVPEWWDPDKPTRAESSSLIVRSAWALQPNSYFTFSFLRGLRIKRSKRWKRWKLFKGLTAKVSPKWRDRRLAQQLTRFSRLKSPKLTTKWRQIFLSRSDLNIKMWSNFALSSYTYHRPHALIELKDKKFHKGSSFTKIELMFMNLWAGIVRQSKSKRKPVFDPFERQDFDKEIKLDRANLSFYHYSEFIHQPYLETVDDMFSHLRTGGRPWDNLTFMFFTWRRADFRVLSALLKHRASYVRTPEWDDSYSNVGAYGAKRFQLRRVDRKNRIKNENRARSRRSQSNPGYEPKVFRADRPLSKARQTNWLRYWSSLVTHFKGFSIYSFRHFFYWGLNWRLPSQRSHHSLIFTFRGSRLFINLQDQSGLNYFGLNVGLFIKFFKNKKSLKKNKALKFLLIKYLRKLLIITNIKSFTLRIMSTPALFQELFSLLTRPLVRPFLNPFNGRTITESPQSFYKMNFITFFFERSQSYAFQKGRKKGRIKRKIRRRLYRSNRVCD